MFDPVVTRCFDQQICVGVLRDVTVQEFRAETFKCQLPTESFSLLALSQKRRSLRRLMEAARLVVAEKGLDAGAAEIAARAEVGVGTLYRRFGTKEALVKDIVKEGTADIQAAAERALAALTRGRGSPDSCTTSAGRKPLTEVQEFIASESWVAAPELRADIMRLRRAIERLTKRAHDAGVLRTDVSWRDITVLSLASANAHTCLGIEATDAQTDRTTAILLASLRVRTGAQPLPGDPPLDLLA
jgi:AcrR family transcriptional regulator